MHQPVQRYTQGKRSVCTANKRNETNRTLSGNYLLRIGITFALSSWYSMCYSIRFSLCSLRGLFGAVIPLICHEIHENNEFKNKRNNGWRHTESSINSAGTRLENRGMLLTRKYLMFKVIVNATNQK